MDKGAASLVDMARRACSRYSARITDIGEIDYDLIRPVLLKIDSPERLYQLEQNSPHIIGKDAEVWLNFIKRDIPDWESKPHQPRDPALWYKVYRKLKREAEQELTAGEDQLRATFANLKAEKETNVAQFLSHHNAKPLPQPARRTRLTYHSHSARTGARGGMKMTTMQRIKKEARDATQSKLNRPMHELQARARGVVTAPPQFLEDLKRGPGMPQSLPPAGKTMQVRPPRPSTTGPRATATAAAAAAARNVRPAGLGDAYDMTADREARLRALKAGKAGPSRQPAPQRSTQEGATDGNLTADFLEDSDLDELPSRDRAGRGSPSKPTPRPTVARVGSPQPALMKKRKQPPSLFTSSPNKKSIRPSSVT